MVCGIYRKFLIRLIFPRNKSGNSSSCENTGRSHQREYFYSLGFKTGLLYPFKRKPSVTKGSLIKNPVSKHFWTLEICQCQKNEKTSRLLSCKVIFSFLYRISNKGQISRSFNIYAVKIGWFLIIFFSTFLCKFLAKNLAQSSMNFYKYIFLLFHFGK